jgi:ribosomal-protein-alanine N-acetyltransferase
MTEADLDAVAAAEALIHAFPWTRGNFADSLAAGHGAWLAQEDKCMTGYAILMQVLDEAHLLNISVLPELQRSGRGSTLLIHIFAQAARGASRKYFRAGLLPAPRLCRNRAASRLLSGT